MPFRHASEDFLGGRSACGVGVGVDVLSAAESVPVEQMLMVPGLGLELGLGLGFGLEAERAGLAATMAGMVGSADMLYITEHSPSCCLRPVMLLREMRSRCRGAVRPDRFRSSSLSRALGKSWAVLGSVSRLYPVVLG